MFDENYNHLALDRLGLHYNVKLKKISRNYLQSNKVIINQTHMKIDIVGREANNYSLQSIGLKSKYHVIQSSLSSIV